MDTKKAIRFGMAYCINSIYFKSYNTIPWAADDNDSDNNNGDDNCNNFIHYLVISD